MRHPLRGFLIAPGKKCDFCSGSLPKTGKTFSFKRSALN